MVRLILILRVRQLGLGSWSPAERLLALAWVIVLVLSLGCSAVQFTSDDPAAKMALLTVDCQPPDAVLFIDGEPIGVVALLKERPVPVPVGPRSVEVVHEGYLPYRTDLDAEAGRMYTLNLDLVRDLDFELESEEASEVEAERPMRPARFEQR